MNLNEAKEILGGERVRRLYNETVNNVCSNSYGLTNREVDEAINKAYKRVDNVIISLAEETLEKK